MQAAYQHALELVTEQPVLVAELDNDVLQDLSGEFYAGDYFLGHPATEDQNAFVGAVIALKMLAGCECDFDRAASARLLRASADAIEQYQFAPAETLESVRRSIESRSPRRKTNSKFY